MARTYIDRRGGHLNSALDAGDGIMIVSPDGRRFFKRICNHQRRRQARRIEREAMIIYWDDLKYEEELEDELQASVDAYEEELYENYLEELEKDYRNDDSYDWTCGLYIDDPYYDRY